jgi:septum formation protein
MTNLTGNFTTKMNTVTPPRSLILASTSKYRKKLLERLALPFVCEAPKTDESAGENEAPADLVSRLATQKALVVANNNPSSIVIGSDQLAVFEDQVIGKPGDHERALHQLMSFSGQKIDFLTAVTVFCREIGFYEQYTDLTQVCFRTLQHDEIERYLMQEKPYDCAGAFKAEAFGIALFESIKSNDPTALIGLPLIQTAAMLRNAGLSVP